MKKSLIIMIFLALSVSAFGQGTVIYNGLSHQFQADPQKTASEYGPANSGWQWETRSMGEVLGVSQEHSQPSLKTSTHTLPVSVQSSHSAPATSLWSNTFKDPSFAGSVSLTGHESGSYFEQDSRPPMQSPVVRWHFAKPQQELEPPSPVIPGQQDEAARNTPGIVVQGEPNAAVVASDDAHSNIVANEEKNTINWVYIE